MINPEDKDAATLECHVVSDRSWKPVLERTWPGLDVLEWPTTGDDIVGGSQSGTETTNRKAARREGSTIEYMTALDGRESHASSSLVVR